MKITSGFLALGFLLGSYSACHAQEKNPQLKTFDDSKQRIELGRVKWGRDLDAALEQSEKSGKPVYVQFQEVPG